MRAFLLYQTDTHGGHKLGLLNPATEIFDEDPDGLYKVFTPKLTAVQEWLWHDVYIPGLDQVARIANGAPIAIMHGGDSTHGVHHPEQLITTSLASQITIANNNLKPALELPNVKALRMMMGTGVHEFGEGASAQLVTSQLRPVYPGIDMRVLYHNLAEVAGVRVDCAHHGPGPGSRTWLRGNVARFYLRDVMFQELLDGRDPPDLLLRGHYHEYVHEKVMIMQKGEEVWSCLVVSPSMCGLGDYGRKATHSAFVLRCGMVLFAIENRKIVDVIPLIESVDLRTREVIF